MSAGASSPPSRPIRAGALEVLLFAVGLLLAGLVALALLWSGTGPYRQLMTGPDPAHDCVMMFTPQGDERCQPVARLVEAHRDWTAYVTGGIADPPRFADIRFTPDEYAHMADVRGVFQTAKLMIPVGLFVMAIRLLRARAAGPGAALRLARDGGLAAAGIVALVGAVAIVAFEPLFIFFHEIFFPQGNYLFDPATSNLVRLYPDWYWEGVTLRIGLSFVGAALMIALGSTLALRRVK